MVTTSMARTVCEVAQAAVGDGADAAGASAEKAADGGLGLACWGSSGAPSRAGRAAVSRAPRRMPGPTMATPSGVISWRVSMSARSRTMPPLKRDGLAVVAGAGSAGGDRDFMLRSSSARTADYFFGGDGLDDGFGGLVVEEFLEDGGVPVEVAGEALDGLAAWVMTRVDGAGWSGDSSRLAERTSRSCGVIAARRSFFHSSQCAWMGHAEFL